HGIGEKGAIKLIEEFGSVDGLIRNLDKVKGKAQEHIRRDLAQLELSRELVTIHRDVPLSPGFEGIGPAQPDPKKLVHFLQSMGFQSLLKKVAEGSRAAEPRDYHLVRNAGELEAMIAELRKAGAFAVDTETTSLFPMQAQIVGASFSAAPMRAFYVPFNADPPVVSPSKGKAAKQALLDALAPILTDPKIRRTGQNTKYDWLVFAANGLRLPPPDFDTMIASYCVAGTSRRHGI